MYDLNAREVNTILAALRLWQRHVDMNRGTIDDWLHAIATNGGTEHMLTFDELGALCYKLNTAAE